LWTVASHIVPSSAHETVERFARGRRVYPFAHEWVLTHRHQRHEIKAGFAAVNLRSIAYFGHTRAAPETAPSTGENDD